MEKSNRRICRLSPEAAAALAFVNGDPGADRRVLECVADEVLRGHQVSAGFQKLANALLAQALFEGKLPAKAAGRRKDELFELRNVERAYRYYELLDGGARRLAEKAAARSSAGMRQVERAMSEYKWLIGLNEQERERFRAWRASVSAEEYESAVLVDLRLRDGRPVTGGASGQTLPKKASDMVKALRQELIDIMRKPEEPLSTLGEDSQAGEH